MSAGAEDHTHTRGHVIRWASRYDVLVQVLSLGQMNRIREQIVDRASVRPGEAVLDVGCGTGGLARALARRVGSHGRVSGIDPSPEMISRAWSTSQRSSVPIDFRIEPVEALSFADGSFDVVVSSFVFHHLPNDLKPNALRSITRVLRPGGRLLLVDFMSRSGESMAHTDPTGAGWLLPEVVRRGRFAEVTAGRLGRLPFGFLIGAGDFGFVSARRPD